MADQEGLRAAAALRRGRPVGHTETHTSYLRTLDTFGIPPRPITEAERQVGEQIAERQPWAVETRKVDAGPVGVLVCTDVLN